MLEIILSRPFNIEIVPLPSAPYAATHQATFAMNGRIYTLGGLNNSIRSIVSFGVYDIASSTWSSPTAFPVPVRSAILFGKGARLIAAGGYDQGGTNTLYDSIYEFVGGVWTKLSVVLPQPMCEMNYETFSDYMTIMSGGSLANSIGYNGTLQMDPAVTNLAITTKQNTPNALGRAGTCVVDDRYLYVAGGRLGNGAGSSAFTRYDRVNNTWETLQSLPAVTMSVNLIQRAGFIYALVTNQNSTYGNFVYVYSIKDNTWTYVAQIGGPIHGITRGVVWNNELYMVGGYNGTTRTSNFSKLVITN